MNILPQTPGSQPVKHNFCGHVSQKRLPKYFDKFEKPIFPLKAQDLLEKYKLKEGKEFGQKIRLLEEMWLNNSFKISNKEIDNVFRN